MSAGPSSSVYEYGKVLGRGSSSVVREGVNRRTGEKFACKIMVHKGRTAQERAKKRDNALREIEVWSSVNHPGIVNLIEFFVDPNSVVIVMELCRGSTLLDEVLTRGGYSVEEARHIFQQVLDVVRYLHAEGVVHRDLKLENLLLRKRRDLSSVKLADMGFAVRLDDSGHYKTMAGTPAYLAPEVISVIEGKKGAMRAFGTPTDMWSCGVALFVLLGGYPPFDADTTKQVFNRVLIEEVKFDTPVWEAVPFSAREMVLQLLNKRPSDRHTAARALKDPFMLEVLPLPAVGGKVNLECSFQNLQKYLTESDLTRREANKDTMEESMEPSKFLEMQQRHDASHGRHLNDSLRKIFKRNANTRKDSADSADSADTEEGEDGEEDQSVVRSINNTVNKHHSSFFEVGDEPPAPNRSGLAAKGEQGIAAVPRLSSGGQHIISLGNSQPRSRLGLISQNRNQVAPA